MKCSKCSKDLKSTPPRPSFLNIVRKKYKLVSYPDSDVWGKKLHVALVQNNSHAMEPVRKVFGKDNPFKDRDEHVYIGVCTASGNDILLTFNTEYRIFPGIVAHECFHAAYWTLDNIMTLCPENEESWAYYIEYLTDRTHAALAQMGVNLQ